MKRALSALSLAVFLGPALLPSAVAQDLAACGKPKGNKQRLHCSGNISKPSTVTAEPSETEISVADFVARFRQLKGKRVKVNVFAKMLGRDFVFQHSREKMTGLNLDASKVSHDQLRTFFYSCESGCEATIVGRAADLPMYFYSLGAALWNGPGIVAESIVVH